MPIRVQIPGPMRPLTGGASEVEVEAADVAGPDRGPAIRATRASATGSWTEPARCDATSGSS